MPSAIADIVGNANHAIRELRPLRDGNRNALGQVVFRLDQEIGEQRTRLTIAGELSGESIELLEACCDQAMRDGQTVDLVLRDITTINEAGRALLRRRLAKRGVNLFANGVYHSYLIDTILLTVNSASIDSNRRVEAFL